MASTPRVFIGWMTLAAAIIAAGCLGAPARAAPEWVKNALSLGHDDQLHSTPTVARFVIQEGGAFILDRSHHPALLKFEDDPEIWALEPSRGPRGDILFKDDVGDTLLRATKLGGITVFTTRRPGGSAAALAGAVTPLRQTPLGPSGLYQRMILASVRSSRAMRHLVSFEAPNADAASAAIIGDTTSIVVDALVSMAGRPGGKAATARVGRVIIITGPRLGAFLRNGALIITVAPSQGLAGHPSSVRIEQVIAAG